MMNLFKQIYQKVLLLFYDLGKKLQAGCYAFDGVLREGREVVSLLIGGKEVHPDPKHFVQGTRPKY